ncbi:hypothetical protein [Stieleria tagensis]|uniref:hypothetical protein n=1 Tax=Stieleria tagensis TaxID=2956795 RepID=UPI00209AE182|nr:hypothetical protein [Stieleria tagensis]
MSYTGHQEIVVRTVHGVEETYVIEGFEEELDEAPSATVRSGVQPGGPASEPGGNAGTDPPKTEMPPTAMPVQSNG